jgi:DNA-binding response OmpR family regulator
MAHIVALVSDPELGAELAAAAEAAGHAVDVCTSEADAWDACAEHAELLVVDLSGEAVDGATLVDSMRAGGELRGVRTLVLHQNDDRAAIARAQEVGFDAVVPRTRMDADAAGLIKRLLA